MILAGLFRQKWASEKGVRETLNVVERRPSSLDISVFSGFTDGRSAGVQRKDRISDAGRSGDRVRRDTGVAKWVDTICMKIVYASI